MRALSRMDHPRLVEVLEASLKALGYSYVKNQGRDFTEFEVRSPCQFLASVESLVSPRLTFFIPRSGVAESAIELRRLVGSTGSEAELSTCVSAFVRELRSALPKEPWKGTGFFRSRAEKARWEKLGEL